MIFISVTPKGASPALKLCQDAEQNKIPLQLLRIHPELFENTSTGAATEVAQSPRSLTRNLQLQNFQFTSSKLQRLCRFNGYRIWNSNSSVPCNFRQVFLQALVHMVYGCGNCSRSRHVYERW